MVSKYLMKLKNKIMNMKKCTYVFCIIFICSVTIERGRMNIIIIFLFVDKINTLY